MFEDAQFIGITYDKKTEQVKSIVVYHPDIGVTDVSPQFDKTSFVNTTVNISGDKKTATTMHKWNNIPVFEQDNGVLPLFNILDKKNIIVLGKCKRPDEVYVIYNCTAAVSVDVVIDLVKENGYTIANGTIENDTIVPSDKNAEFPLLKIDIRISYAKDDING